MGVTGFNSLMAIPDSSLTESWGKALGRSTDISGFDIAYDRITSIDESLAPSWFFYFAGIRDITSNQGTTYCLKALNSEKFEQRLGAAHYLSRTRNISLESSTDQLLSAFKSEKQSDIRTALGLALKNSPLIDSDTYMALIMQETDERVQISLLRSAWRTESLQPEDILPLLTENHHPSIRTSCANWLADQVWTPELYQLITAVHKAPSSEIAAPIMKGILRYNEGEAFWIDLVKTQIQSTQSPYEKGNYLRALEGIPSEITFLSQFLDPTLGAPVSIAAAEALIATREFDKWSGPVAFEDVIEIALDTNDPSIISLFALHISQVPEESLGEYPVLPLLEEKLPVFTDFEYTETYLDLQRAIANLKREDFKEPEFEYNHPPVFENLFKDNILVNVVTTKGDFEMELYPMEAPLTVHDFVSKADSGYYNQKPVHRVVPAFVIQTGCKRGDGWGSEAYTLRSEFNSLPYRTGVVGKASVGKDTEGVQ
ncbi:MAG: peptidylprolyl isomerase, partial [Bacteroidota bacterium]